jgi:hypothetical protein
MVWRITCATSLGGPLIYRYGGRYGPIAIVAMTIQLSIEYMGGHIHLELGTRIHCTHDMTWSLISQLVQLSTIN